MKKRVKSSKNFSVNINISNRWLYTFVLAGIILIVGAGFFAASLLPTNGAIPNPGHPINQTAPPKGCQAGQVLQWVGVSNNDGGWACTSPSSLQSNGFFANTQVFTSGTTWTVPSGVTNVLIACIGGGGSGGGSTTSGDGGSGGGGGGMIVGEANLRGLSSVSVAIGAGGPDTGTGGTGNAPDGAAGGSSSVSWIAGSTTYRYTATGGSGGSAANSDCHQNGNDVEAGGSAGSGSAIVPDGTWYYLSPGSVGGNGGCTSSGNGGAAAGYSPSGFNQWIQVISRLGRTYSGSGAAGVGGYTSGNPGQIYGSGGSGGHSDDSKNKDGGAGASGICVIYY